MGRRPDLFQFLGRSEGIKKGGIIFPPHTPYMVVNKPLPRRALPTPATRQRQKIVMIKQCCKLWSRTMPALMNTWRPKHDQESNDEYRQRVVESGDGDIYRGMQIMHRAHAHQNAVIEHLLRHGTDNHGVRTIRCSMCGQQEYLLDNQSNAGGIGSTTDPNPVCVTCAYVREDTLEWLNQKRPAPNASQEL